MSASLLLQSGEVLTRISLANGGLTIGRLPENDLTLDSESIRPRHARIIMSPEGYVLENLNPTGRTLVNDERIERRVLRHGDRVTLGGYSAVFASAEGREPELPLPAAPAPDRERDNPGSPPETSPQRQHAGRMPLPGPDPDPAGARDPVASATAVGSGAAAVADAATETDREPRPAGGTTPEIDPGESAGPPDSPASPAIPEALSRLRPDSLVDPDRRQDGAGIAAATPAPPLNYHQTGDLPPLGYLHIVSGNLRGHVMTISKPRTTIGFKGRRIALVEYDRGHFRIRRVDSTRTVMLNGDPLGATTTGLKPGDTLELADTRLYFTRERPESTPQ